MVLGNEIHVRMQGYRIISSLGSQYTGVLADNNMQQV